MYTTDDGTPRQNLNFCHKYGANLAQKTRSEYRMHQQKNR
jgi:hypothetical protein